MSTLSSGQIESTSQIHRLIPQITKLWLTMSPNGSTDSPQRVSINEGTLTSFYLKYRQWRQRIKNKWINHSPRSHRNDLVSLQSQTSLTARWIIRHHFIHHSKQLSIKENYKSYGINNDDDDDNSKAKVVISKNIVYSDHPESMMISWITNNLGSTYTQCCLHFFSLLWRCRLLGSLIVTFEIFFSNRLRILFFYFYIVRKHFNRKRNCSFFFWILILVFFTVVKRRELLEMLRYINILFHVTVREEEGLE